MLNTSDPEDRQIRIILISAAVAAVVGFMVVATGVAVLVSMNFNVMNWLE